MPSGHAEERVLPPRDLQRAGGQPPVAVFRCARTAYVSALGEPMIVQPIDYFLIVWFALAGLSAAYVAWDQFRHNPEPVVRSGGSCW